ncbi:arsenite efflux ATP-binding protein ArsA [Gottschalkia purinilytica]|uniref:arsenite-transporting ATPase n=1 Tax=Gottschalkia purinilytica TaxID=1503 RepID=A0A0L0W9V9_GOTPU|nr:ArsA family ATPase [Gottschalkia purinilytica]KNF08343.1 arsenite efflux ATP-binding protein ArsA [Gottschalkia purinilytica]
MRIILYTGKGGVGKTSIAAATAAKSAQSGKKTLIISADPAHSLGDALDISLESEPIEIMENMWAQEINTLYEMEKGWKKVQDYLTSLFTAKTVKDITTEELTIFPGMEDLLSLLRILDYYKSKTYDVIIVDCAPTGETLKLLSFPEMLRWWMEKLFPLKRKALKILGPVAQPILGLPMPDDSVMGEIENLYIKLDEMRNILIDRDTTSIRIVVNPEKMVIKESQRSFTYLNIYNFNVDSIIVNRVIPDDVNEGYFKEWKEIHKKYLKEIHDSFSPVPIYHAPLFDQELVGIDMLIKMSNIIFKNDNAVDIKYSNRTQKIEKIDDDYVYSVYMPFMKKQDLDLNQKGDEIIVRAGDIKRNIILPRTLTKLSIKEAKFDDEVLKIRFGGEENE